MKYIIKNCPAIMKSMVCVNDKHSNLCQDITDCVLKRIAEICDNNGSKILYDSEIKKLKFFQGDKSANEILELLDMEECE